MVGNDTKRDNAYILHPMPEKDGLTHVVDLLNERPESDRKLSLALLIQAL